MIEDQKEDDPKEEDYPEQKSTQLTFLSQKTKEPPKKHKNLSLLVQNKKKAKKGKETLQSSLCFV